MRTLFTLLLAIFLVFFTAQSAYAKLSETENEAIVIKIDGLKQTQNVNIYTLFSERNDLRVINSCQELGLVVIQYRGEAEISKVGISNMVRALLRDQLSISDFQLMEDYALDAVNTDCRLNKRKELGQ